MAGVLVALIILAGAMTGVSQSAQADEPSGWVPSHLASSSVWLNLRRQDNFFEFNLKIQMETTSCHRITDPGTLERLTPQQFVVNLVKEQKTNLEVCSGQSPVMQTEPYGLRSLEPGSYEFIVQNNGEEVSRWGISVISDTRGACIADIDNDFHISRSEVTNIVTAYLIAEPVGGIEIPDRAGAVDALSHYLLHGADPPPTLLCQSDTMPRWKAPLKFVPPKYVYIGKDLTVLMRTLEATSSDEVIDVSVTIKGFEANKPYEVRVDAVSAVCGNTRLGYIERCWSANFQDIPDNYALTKNKIFDVTVKSAQITSGQSAEFIIEPDQRSLSGAGVDGGRHIVISHDPPLNMVVAIEYDISSVDILRLVSDESQDGQAVRQSNVGQSYLQIRFETRQIAATTRLVLTHRMSDSNDSVDAGPPIEIIVNGQHLPLESGTALQADQINGHVTTEWSIAHLLNVGENIIQMRISNSTASEFEIDRFEITR
ncbi:MAG: hypothetical protein IIB17_10035 [Chloroflexi bacterium]|nr:hypothetical protein [Chloroflexota bacterium]